MLAGRDAAALQVTADECKGAADVSQVAGDLSVEADVEKLVQTTIQHYQQLDVLVRDCLSLYL